MADDYVEIKGGYVPPARVVLQPPSTTKPISGNLPPARPVPPPPPKK